MAHGLRDTAHANGQSFAAYCYTSAENTQMRRILDTSRLAPDAATVEAFIASDQWVDLHEVFKTQVITGHGTGLKTVAALAGFAWRDDDPGGDQSMVWYDRAVNDPDPAVRADNRNRLLRYNEDDVRATCALREWMTTSGPDLPSIATWTAEVR